MIKDYLYRKTPKISSLITQINTYRDLFDRLSIPPKVQENLQNRALIKSALYSARIEGNSLELAEIEKELELYIRKMNKESS